MEEVVVPTLSSSLGSFEMCGDDTLEITAVGAPANYTYRWFLNSSLVSSDTTLSYTINPGDITANAVIELEVVNTAGCTSTLISQNITFNSSPNSTIATGLPGNTLCSGDDFTLTLTQTDYTAGTTTFTVVYGTNNREVTTTTGQATLTIVGLTAETLFTVTTENGDGCSSTDSITVYVPKLDNAGTIATAASTTICAGDYIDGNITSTATASLAAGSSTATIEYEWQFLSTATPTWTKIPGSTNSSTLTTNTLSNFPIYGDTQIRRLARAVRGSVKCEGVFTPVINITVEEVVVPTLSSSLGSFEMCSDDTLEITAVGAPVNYTYRWFLNSSLVSSDTTLSYTINPGDITANAVIELEVVNTAGCTSTLISQNIIFNAGPTVEISGLPGNTLCAGDDFVLTLNHTDYAAGTTTFTVIYGSNTRILTTNSGIVTTTINNILAETSFTVTTENGDGCSSTDSITVYVPKVDNAGTIATAAATTICAGDYIDGNITSTATASLAAGSSTATIEYEWQFLSTTTPTWTKIPGSTNSSTLATGTLRLFPIYENIQIRRLARAVRGSVKCDDVVSPAILITVEDVIEPTLSSSLGVFEVCEDEAITITAVGAPANYTYIWILNGTTVSSDTTSFYTIDAGDISADATLQLEVVNTAGCTSTLISQIITYNEGPEVTLSTGLPGDTLCSGDGFTLDLDHTDYAAGTTTFTIRYGINTIIRTTTTGQATASILNITGETLFTVTTESGDGCSSTDSITVYVPEIGDAGDIATAASTTICAGDVIAGNITSTTTASLSAGSSTATIEYEWQYLSTTTPTWTKIPGSTNSSTLTTNTLSTFRIYENTQIRRLAKAVRAGVKCSDGVASPAILITVEDVIEPTLSSSLGVFEVCEDEAITITAVGAPANYTYIWILNGTTVSSDTTSFYTIDVGDISADATLQLEVVNTAGCTSTLISQIITYNEGPEVTLSTGLPGDTLCSGDGFTLDLDHTDYAAGTTTFTIRYGINTIIRTTTTGQATASILNITGETLFTVTTESGDGCSSTDSITVYVPEIGDAGDIATAASTTICAGDVIAGNITSTTTASLSAAVPLQR